MIAYLLARCQALCLVLRIQKGLRHGLALKELMIFGISERNEETGTALIKVESAAHLTERSVERMVI